MVPQRKGDLASVVLRALLTGICVSMLNACLAGRSLPTASRAREIQGGTGPINAAFRDGGGWPVPSWLWQSLQDLLSPHGSPKGSPSPTSSPGAPHPPPDWNISMTIFGVLQWAPLKSWGLRWDGSWDLHSPRHKICKQVWSRCGACEQAWDKGLTACLGYGIWIHGTS